MSTKPSFATLAQTTAVSLSIFLATGAGAWAQQADIYHVGQNNDFGAQQDAAVRAASAAPSATPLTTAQRKVLDDAFQVGRNNDFGGGIAQQPVYAQRDVQSRFASTVPMVQGKPDAVGASGPQDDLARQIYTPGRGTFFDRGPVPFGQ
jgi:hypothetical protein